MPAAISPTWRGVIADMTTGDPNATRAMAGELKARGITLIDAPVSGGPHGADAGTIAIMVGAPEALFATIRHAGAAFLGPFCPEAVGDYVGGPNHVLPTGRTARFASGLSVFDFLKRTTWIAAGKAALDQVGPAAVALAEAEGLQAHARSIAIRLGNPPVA